MTAYRFKRLAIKLAEAAVLCLSGLFVLLLSTICFVFAFVMAASPMLLIGAVLGSIAFAAAKVFQLWGLI